MEQDENTQYVTVLECERCRKEMLLLVDAQNNSLKVDFEASLRRSMEKLERSLLDKITERNEISEKKNKEIVGRISGIESKLDKIIEKMESKFEGFGTKLSKIDGRDAKLLWILVLILLGVALGRGFDFILGA